MKKFINNTLIEAGNLLNSQLEKKQFIEYKESNGMLFVDAVFAFHKKKGENH